MDKAETISTFSEGLKKLRIPAHEIKVFGVARINVHVHTLSMGAAHKWAMALRKIGGKDATISLSETLVPAKKNKGTCLLPTMRRMYFVGAIV